MKTGEHLIRRNRREAWLEHVSDEIDTNNRQNLISDLTVGFYLAAITVLSYVILPLAITGATVVSAQHPELTDLISLFLCGWAIFIVIALGYIVILSALRLGVIVLKTIWFGFEAIRYYHYPLEFRISRFYHLCNIFG